MIQIKNRYTNAVLYECEAPDGLGSGLHIRYALGKATSSGVNLSGADLRGAYLSGADLSNKKLIGNRPVLQIGPIGSRCDYLVACLTDSGVMVKAGCFFGTIAEFSDAVQKTHGDSDHGQEYRMAMLMIESHAAIWSKL